MTRILMAGAFLGLGAMSRKVRILATLAAGVLLLTMTAQAEGGASGAVSLGPLLGPGAEGYAWPASFVLAAWLVGRVRPTLHLDVTHRDAPRLERIPDQEPRP